MENNYVEGLDGLRGSDLPVNRTCDYDAIPTSDDYLERLGVFGVGLLSAGSILSTATLYLALDAAYNILSRPESRAYKTNCLTILLVYPIASVCSLVATALPRSQLLSEALTQVALMISFYRLFRLLIDVGRRNVSKPPGLALKVGPCCCWPCIPFPSVEMTDTNLSYLEASVLQVPFVQGFVYCALLVLRMEDPTLAKNYEIFMQPICVPSILLSVFGLTVTTKSLQEVAPDAKLHHKTAVIQVVLLFSKLQGGVIKSLPMLGVFPCNPPVTPTIYANVTYNALMLIEMLLLCYIARIVYTDPGKQGDEPTRTTDESRDKTGPEEVMNNNEPRSIQLAPPPAVVTV